jgi:hypothetical protein
MDFNFPIPELGGYREAMRLRLGMVVLGLCLCACASSSGPSAGSGQDSGVMGTDASLAADGQTSMEASTVADSGGTADSSVSVEAGREAGAPEEAGAPLDAALDAPGTLSGQVVDNAYTGLAGFTVTVGQALSAAVGNPVMASTSSTGAWSMPTPTMPGEWLTLQMGPNPGSSDGYDLLQLQNFMVSGSWSFGDFDLGSSTAVRGMLDGLTDAGATGGLVLIHVGADSVSGPCASAVGATVTVTGADGGTFPVAYFTQNAVDATARSVRDTSRYSAVAYDLAPSTTVSVSISHPTCQQSPWPVTVHTSLGTLTYSGDVQVPAAPGLALLTAWIQ